MKITVVWFGDQFNVSLASAEGREAFLDIKGCRIANGQRGEFISWPSTKNPKTDKWWQHVYASEGFAVEVLKEANKSRDTRTLSERRPKRPNDPRDHDTPMDDEPYF